MKITFLLLYFVQHTGGVLLHDALLRVLMEFCKDQWFVTATGLWKLLN